MAFGEDAPDRESGQLPGTNDKSHLSGRAVSGITQVIGRGATRS